MARLKPKKIWRHEFPERQLLYNLKCKCRRRGLDFDLALEDLKIPGRCPVLGIPLEWSKGQRTDNTPSIDRIDNGRGYVKDNVIIVSWRANRLKSDATIEELRRLAKFYGKKTKSCSRA